jgi:farnesyl diphosphate synthase
MDNDDFRRGQPTCHKEFSEATAILAGDSLLTYAFEILANSQSHPDAIVRCELIRILARAAGFAGMAGGQMMDLEKADEEISNEELAKLHRLKTGELFMASAEMGAVIGGASNKERMALRNFAHDLGLAFQIKDDILDHVGTNVGKMEIDEAIHKKPEENASIVDVVGMENAQQRLTMLKDQAILHLQIFGEKADLLKDLTQFVALRDK